MDTGIGSEDQTLSLEIELAIPFQTVILPDSSQQSSSMRSLRYHPSQNEVVTNSSNMGGHMDQGSHPDI
ncbi:hypothetical protein TNCV_4939501 [Trichonephila clavipes]|nr:hypothetical protein TNCV_4939501 [Trichonephila clavipes]